MATTARDNRGHPPPAATADNELVTSRVAFPAFVVFLDWALARAGLRPRGFKNFRGTIRKRLAQRMGELGIADVAAYRARLEEDPAEWRVFDAMCRITIS